MLESINKLKNLKLNGEKLNNDSWESPAELIQKVRKEERKKLFLTLFLSNLTLILYFNIFNESNTSEIIKTIEKDHSIIKISAQLLIPLHISDKKQVSLLTKDGKFLSKAFLLSEGQQQITNHLGPWKLEVPKSNMAIVLQNIENVLKIAPKETEDFSTKEEIYEIKF